MRKYAISASVLMCLLVAFGSLFVIHRFQQSHLSAAELKPTSGIDLSPPHNLKVAVLASPRIKGYCRMSRKLYALDVDLELTIINREKNPIFLWERPSGVLYVSRSKEEAVNRNYLLQLHGPEDFGLASARRRGSVFVVDTVDTGVLRALQLRNGESMRETISFRIDVSPSAQSRDYLTKGNYVVQVGINAAADRSALIQSRVERILSSTEPLAVEIPVTVSRCN